jgi:DNA-binding response OmpR family regulator
VPRILVVDDEPLISMLLENWLAELGCEVAGPARSVADGLVVTNSGVALDGAILDVNLDRENSFPLAQALRARGVPIVFATGDSSLNDASGFGGSLVLEKPFDFEAVKATVEALLSPDLSGR